MWSVLALLFAAGVSASNMSDAGPLDICDSIHELQCYGDDIADIGPVNTHEECCNRCKSQEGCKAWTWNWQRGQHCYLKHACINRKKIYGYHSGYGPAVPTPAPTPGPPTPAPPPTPPTPENPLGIVPAPKREDNYFLILGDWGAPTDAPWAHSCGGCQRKVADLMKTYVNKYKQQGKKCLFVAALGDNFYASGLKDDEHWKKQWSEYYGVLDPYSALYDIPWFGVYGNHDMGDADPTCACGKGCKQFNGNHRPSGTEKFWMPDYYWHYYIDEIKLEVIGLDTNAVDAKGLNGNGCGECTKVCGGFNSMQHWLTGKMNEGLSYIEQRAQQTEATTVLLMQHYNWGWNQNIGKLVKSKFDNKNNGKAKSLSAYGHAHDQRCEGDRTHGCDVILSGGGGGWRGGRYFGFTAVHLTADGGYQTVLESDEVRFSQQSCQYMDGSDAVPAICVENSTSFADRQLVV